MVGPEVLAGGAEGARFRVDRRTAAIDEGKHLRALKVLDDGGAVSGRTATPDNLRLEGRAGNPFSVLYLRSDASENNLK
jgi:hypothetical protein